MAKPSSKVVRGSNSFAEPSGPDQEEGVSDEPHASADLHVLHGSVYQSDQATEPASRHVHPYGFTYHNGSLYLIARDPEAERIKHYKLDRAGSVEVSLFPFRRPPDFDIRQHLLPSFGVYLTDGPLRYRATRPEGRWVLGHRWPWKA